MTEPAATAPDEVWRVRRMAERRDWRGEQAALVGLELVVSTARVFTASHGVGMALLVPVDAAPSIGEAIGGVREMARQDPPPSRDWLYDMRGDLGPVVVAHTETASLILRAGGPYLAITDAMGKLIWRFDGDPVWDDDVAELLRDLLAAIGRRPAEPRPRRTAQEWQRLLAEED